MSEIVAGNVKQIVAQTNAGRSDMYRVPLAALAIREGFNAAREADPEYPEHVEWLTASIMANGLYKEQPIIALPADDGKWYISDGHCRFAAILAANALGKGIEYAFVIAEDKSVTAEDRGVGLVTRNGGKRLTPYGEGIALKDLLGLGLDEKEISRRTGFPMQKVQNVLGLVGAPKEMRDMVKSGRVSSTLAIETLKEEGAGAVATLKAAEAVATAKGKKKVMKKDVKAAKAADTTPPVTPAAGMPSAQQQAFASANAVLAKQKKKDEPWITLPNVKEVQAAMSEKHRAAISSAAIGIVLEAIASAMGYSE